MVMRRQKEVIERLVKNTKAVQKHEPSFHRYDLFSSTKYECQADHVSACLALSNWNERDL